MLVYRPLPFVAIVLTSACGAAGSGGDRPQVLQSFSALTDTAVVLLDDLESADLTPTANIPDGGAFTYDGVATFLLPGDDADGVIGQARVNVNFSSSAVTGGANNFFDLSGNPTSGSLSIENGALNSDFRSLFAGELNGDITFGAGPMDIETSILGTFSGPDAELVSIVAAGTATPFIGTPIDIEGAILAEN